MGVARISQTAMCNTQRKMCGRYCLQDSYYINYSPPSYFTLYKVLVLGLLIKYLASQKWTKLT